MPPHTSKVCARELVQTCIRLAIVDPAALVALLRGLNPEQRARLAWCVALELGNIDVFCSPPNILEAWARLLGEGGSV